MQLQDIYNNACKHFAAMPEPSMAFIGEDGEDGFQCAYRGENNASCIIGSFIPDSLYNPSLEGDSFYWQHGDKDFHNSRVSNVVAEAFEQERLTLTQYALLSELQKVHDRNAEDWKAENPSTRTWFVFIKPLLAQVASQFNLESPVLEESK